MERVLPPQHRHVVGLGGRLERAVEPPEPVGDELLAADADIGEAGAARVTRRGRRGENAWMSTHRSSSWSTPSAVPGAAAGVGGAGAQQRAARPARAAARPAFGIARETVAEPRRLAGEHDPAARSAARGGTRRTRARDPGGGAARRGRARGQSSRPRTGATPRRRGRSARAARAASALASSVRQHPGRDVGARRLVDDARLEHVQAEVAGAGADLERTAVAAVELGAEQLAKLADHLRLSDLAEVDPPLGVVAGRCDVVVARVDVADLVAAKVAVAVGASMAAVRLPCRPCQ